MSGSVYEIRVTEDRTYELWDRTKNPDEPLAAGFAFTKEGVALLAGAALVDQVAGFNATKRLLGMGHSEIIALVQRLAAEEPR